MFSLSENKWGFSNEWSMCHAWAWWMPILFLLSDKGEPALIVLRVLKENSDQMLPEI